MELPGGRGFTFTDFLGWKTHKTGLEHTALCESEISRYILASTFLFRFMSSILALSSFILFIVIEFSRLCCEAAQLSPSSSSVHTLYRELPLK